MEQVEPGLVDGDDEGTQGLATVPAWKTSQVNAAWHGQRLRVDVRLGGRLATGLVWRSRRGVVLGVHGQGRQDGGWRRTI